MTEFSKLSTKKPFSKLTPASFANFYLCNNYRLLCKAANKTPPNGGRGPSWPSTIGGVLQTRKRVIDAFLEKNKHNLVALGKNRVAVEIAAQLVTSAFGTGATSVVFLNSRNSSYTQIINSRTIALTKQMDDLSSSVFNLPKMVSLPQLEHLRQRMEELSGERIQINNSITTFNNPALMERLLQNLPLVEFKRGTPNTLIYPVADFSNGVKDYLQPLIVNLPVHLQRNPIPTPILPSIKFQGVLIVFSMILWVVARARLTIQGAALPFMVQTDKQIEFLIKWGVIVNQVIKICTILVGLFFTGINILFYLAFNYIVGRLILKLVLFSLPEYVIQWGEWLFEKIVEKTIIWVGTFLLYLIVPIYMVLWCIVQLFRVIVLKHYVAEISENIPGDDVSPNPSEN